MAVVAVSAGCGETPEPTTIKVSPASATLQSLGDTVQLAATVEDQDGETMPNVTITWTSRDTRAATVDGNGLVTAAGNGTATVEAAAGAAVGAAEVTVAQRPAEVAVSPLADTLVALDDTVRLTAEAFDANGHTVAGAGFTWSSGDESVVTVDAGGLVTAVARGGAGVTAATGDVSGGASVTVEQRPAVVRVSPGEDTLAALGDTVRLSAEAFDPNGHVLAGAAFTWSSGDESVVTVDAEGLVTAVANGAASVQAYIGTATGSARGVATVIVAQRAVQVRVVPADATLEAFGDTLRLSAEAEDANGHPIVEAGFSWTSTDSLVAAVDGMGLVTAVANGAVTIAATMDEASGAAALTVAQRAVELSVSPRTDTLVVADTVRLAAEAFDGNGHVLTNALFAWTSGDEAVAMVDAGGLVTGVGGGSAAVTVTESTAGLVDSVSLRVVDPREELAGLYEALGGDGWTHAENWGTGAPLGEWYGVTTDERGRVTGLDLSGNGLSGEIPAELGLLESLEVLDLSGSGMQDQAEPEQCASPPSPLSVGGGLTGSIPAALGALKRLGTLDLGYNSLTGSIPPELGDIGNLKVLDLGWNMLTGSIPGQLGGLGDLEVLALCRQRRWDGSEHLGGLTGSIPPELGDLKSLEVLNLRSNGYYDSERREYVGGLTGSIPEELAELENLRVLSVVVNSLEGSIPGSLGRLARLDSLGLAANDLTGPVPPELGDLQSLEWLSLSANGLTGSIPPELGGLEDLEGLHLWSNGLTGPIPPELGDLQHLEELGLWGNGLTGSIPPQLGDLQSLGVLYLDNNSLTGSIPPQLGDLENLRRLYLNDTGVTGSLPPELGGLGSLRRLKINSTSLTGPIPGDFTDIPLQLFHWHETDLCAPGDEEFREWLASIDDHMGGDTCPGS